MKKKMFVVPLLLALAVSGKAVTISWAVPTMPTVPTGFTFERAILVWSDYLEPCVAPFEGFEQVGDDVTTYYFFGIGEQLALDTEEREDGYYYIQMFANDGETTYYTTSMTGLEWNDNSGKIASGNAMTPPTSVFMPNADEGDGGFCGWQPVPEPGVTSLLFAGIATMLLRRRRTA